MKAKWLGLVAAGLLACPGPREPAGPNGKAGVLFFFPEAKGPVAQGLEMEVLLPARLTSVSGGHHLEYDFEGTTLELEADAGVSAGASWRHGRSWRFTYRGEPSDEDTGERELRVRVRNPDGAERYADALAVTCRRPTALHFTDGSPWSAAPSGDGVVRYAVGAQLELEAVRPGGGLALHLGGHAAPVPVEVVEPSGVRFGLKVRYEKGSGWFVRAGGLLASDGTTEVGGWGPCELEVRPFLEKSTHLPSSCVTRIPDSASRGEVCATFQGRRACADFQR